MKLTAKQRATLIVQHIKQHGGTPTATARELDIKFTPAVRASLNEIEPNIARWRHAFKRFGSWLTLPTDAAPSRNEQQIDCVCTNCGAHKSVALLNLISGRSIACKQCAMRNRHKLMVTDGDAEVHRSIRAFASAIGKPEKYQTLRHNLIAGKSVEVDGKEYSLVETRTPLLTA